MLSEGQCKLNSYIINMQDCYEAINVTYQIGAILKSISYQTLMDSFKSRIPICIIGLHPNDSTSSQSCACLTPDPRHTEINVKYLGCYQNCFIVIWIQ